MNTRERLQRVNRHGGAIAASFLLLVGTTFAHWSARLRMEMANRQFALMDDRTIREMTAIDFLHDHYWIGIFYAAAFLIGLLWLEFRASRCWLVWGSFVLFAAPCCAYLWACMHIGVKFVAFM